MYEPILLKKTVIEDPFLFPDSNDNVLMFLGAKDYICFDERVEDVRLSLINLENHNKWVKNGMPDEGAGEYVRPTDEQVERMQVNTLDAVYHNPKVWGLYIQCRREDVESLFESADKVAAYLAAQTGVQSQTGEYFYLRGDDEDFSLRNTNSQRSTFTIDGESEMAENIRATVCLSANFAVASRFFYPSSPDNFPNAFFFPHIPQTLKSMLLIPVTDTRTLSYNFKTASIDGVMTLDFPDGQQEQSRIVRFPTAIEEDRFSQSEIRIENINGEPIYRGGINMTAFSEHIFGPLLNHAASMHGKDRIEQSLKNHLDIMGLSATGAVPRDNFIKDFIPSI